MVVSIQYDGLHKSEHQTQITRLSSCRDANMDIQNMTKTKEIGAQILEYILTQYSLGNGLKLYGEKRLQATKNELTQQHDLDMFELLDADSLTNHDKKNAIASLMILTKKRDESIKGRACADDRKECESTDKLDAASPTVMLESIFITATINTKEERDIAIMDLLGLFCMHTMMKKW